MTLNNALTPINFCKKIALIFSTVALGSLVSLPSLAEPSQLSPTSVPPKGAVDAAPKNPEPIIEEATEVKTPPVAEEAEVKPAASNEKPEAVTSNSPAEITKPVPTAEGEVQVPAATEKIEMNVSPPAPAPSSNK
jgi:hypothetical protein